MATKDTSKIKGLSALNLKERLWDTLDELKRGKIDINEAAATSGLAREIIRCVNTQLNISRLSSTTLPKEILDFNGSETKSA